MAIPLNNPVSTFDSQTEPSSCDAASVIPPERMPQETRDLGCDATEATHTREALWLAESQSAIGAWNDYVKEYGLPLAAFQHL